MYSFYSYNLSKIYVQHKSALMGFVDKNIVFFFQSAK